MPPAHTRYGTFFAKKASNTLTAYEKALCETSSSAALALKRNPQKWRACPEMGGLVELAFKRTGFTTEQLARYCGVAGETMRLYSLSLVTGSDDILIALCSAACLGFPEFMVLRARFNVPRQYDHLRQLIGINLFEKDRVTAIWHAARGGKVRKDWPTINCSWPPGFLDKLNEYRKTLGSKAKVSTTNTMYAIEGVTDYFLDKRGIKSAFGNHRGKAHRRPTIGKMIRKKQRDKKMLAENPPPPPKYQPVQILGTVED
jgi:hypothetical protein